MQSVNVKEVDNIKVNVVIFTLDALRTRNLTNISWILEKFEDNSLLGYCVVLSQKSVNILPLNVCELLEDYMVQYPRSLPSSYPPPG